jgi:transcriptional regulator with XRE-family HTH domain
MGGLVWGLRMEMNKPLPQGFAQRLKRVIRAQGSVSTLAATIGRSEGAVRNWLSGRTEPAVSDLLAICRTTNIRVEWLLTGAGSSDPAAVDAVREPQRAYGAAEGTPPLDEALLRLICEALEEELVRTGLSLSPIKKAGIIVESYHFNSSAQQFSADSVRRLLALAAPDVS